MGYCMVFISQCILQERHCDPEYSGEAISIK